MVLIVPGALIGAFYGGATGFLVGATLGLIAFAILVNLD